MRRRFVLLLAAVGCSDPNLNEYTPRTGIIQGEILYDGPAPMARPQDDCPDRGADRGNVVLRLSAGASGPASVVVVPAPRLFGGDARDGLFSAAYTIPTVAPGTYTLRGFLDVDGDFNPAVSVLEQPSAGDVAGGHIDPQSGALLPIAVAADQAVEQITVRLFRRVPVERPVFSMSDGTTLSPSFSTRLRLAVDPVQRSELCLDPDRTAFVVQYVDVDEDGRPDDANGDGLPDVYPQISLRRINEPTPGVSVVVPMAVDPTPYLDALVDGPVLTSALEAVFSSSGLVVSEAGDRQALPMVPEGLYEVSVALATGQSWRIPNDLEAVQPTADPATCPSEPLTCGDGPSGCPCRCPAPTGPPPACADPSLPPQCECLRIDPVSVPPGGVRGTLRVATASVASAFVCATLDDFAERRIAACARVPASAFSARSGDRVASFRIAGLVPGRYRVVAVYDVDGNFSPYSRLFSEPSAPDMSAELTVDVAGEELDVEAVRLEGPVGFERPVFGVESPRRLQAGRPGRIALVARSLGLFGSGPAALAIAVGETDADGDNLADATPAVWLTQLVDGGDARTAPAAPAGVRFRVPINSVPYLNAAGEGPRAESSVEVLVPDILPQTGRPPPPGRYRVELASPTGQTWFAPSDVDLLLGRAGTARADPAQAAAVVLSAGQTGPSGIEGQVRLPAPFAGPGQVVVEAFAAEDPPPPAGRGDARARTLVSAEAFEGTDAPYALEGLADGRYIVRAFIDADDNFITWFPNTAQPTQGDILGGVRDMSGRSVQVDVQGPTTADVTFFADGALARGPPAFVLPPNVRLASDADGMAFDLTAVTATTALLGIEGGFVVQWVDLDDDGTADDVDGDGAPDVFPLVEAARLDPADPAQQTLASGGLRLVGRVDPAQFGAFPSGDPTAVSVQVAVDTVQVFLPTMGRAADGTVARAPAGRYAVTVTNAHGQRWRTPNIFQQLRVAPVAEGQSRAVEVEGQ